MSKTFRIMTQKSGPMVFGVFLDRTLEDIQKLLIEIHYAHRLYEKLPQLFPLITEIFNNQMVASSIFGTTSIEGAALKDEEEVAAVLALPPEEQEVVEKLATANMKRAYAYAGLLEPQTVAFKLTEEQIKKIHALVTDGLPMPRNNPGHYRDNPRDVPTYVGHERVGGIYRPPKTRKDIEILMGGLVEWVNSDETRAEDPLIIAPIVQLYFEIIHPFWDGNGRVGRVLEAMIIRGGEYRRAHFLMAKYYNDNVEEYFSLFNECRMAMQKKDTNAHYPFVKFFLKGFLVAIEETYNKVISTFTRMACKDYFRWLLDRKDINRRQHVILLELQQRGATSKKGLESQPWYNALYHNRTQSTRLRDLKKLREKNLLNERDGKLVVFHIP